jgi:hypothetical protein
MIEDRRMKFPEDESLKSLHMTIHDLKTKITKTVHLKKDNSDTEDNERADR